MLLFSNYTNKYNFDIVNMYKCSKSKIFFVCLCHIGLFTPNWATVVEYVNACIVSDYESVLFPLIITVPKQLNWNNTTVLYCCSAEEIQRRRLCDRIGCDVTTAQQRIDAQIPLVDKCRRATVVIDNMGSIDELQQTVNSVYLWLRAKKTHWKIRMLALSLLGFVTVLLWTLWRMLLFP